MHLGFHIYDVGFQSPNVEAAKPMVYMTTLLLLAVVVALNLTAILIRERLRRKLRIGDLLMENEDMETLAPGSATTARIARTAQLTRDVEAGPRRLESAHARAGPSSTSRTSNLCYGAEAGALRHLAWPFRRSRSPPSSARRAAANRPCCAA